jgi:hypothetical protein
MKDLIKTHVKDPIRIEAECARVRKGSVKLGIDIKKVAQRVVSLWQVGRPNDALQVALWGDSRNPKSPDLKCLLGRAYLKDTQPNAINADKAFKQAYDLRCSRSELLPCWIEAKKSLNDWVGILGITKLPDRTMSTSDILIHRAEAHAQLAEIAVNVGDLMTAAEHYHNGGKEIDEAFAKHEAKGKVFELNELRDFFMQGYVSLIDQLTPNPDKHVDVWLAVVDSFKCYVRRALLIRLGVERLISWWNAVEQREIYELKTANFMNVQLNTLFSMLRVLKGQQSPDVSLVDFLQKNAEELSQRLENYREILVFPVVPSPTT